MQISQDTPLSTFEQIADKLRNKSEEELKLLNLKFFSKELSNEWETIIRDADFTTATEEDIVKAIKRNGSKQKNK